MKRMNYLLLLVLTSAFCSCNGGVGETATDDVVIDTLALHAHLSILASDEFMGRKPFTEGEEKTVNYLQSELQRMGLAPGNDSSYFQEVPLVEIIGEQSPAMTVETESGTLSFKTNDDVVVYSERPEALLSIEESPLVFAAPTIIVLKCSNLEHFPSNGGRYF